MRAGMSFRTKLALVVVPPLVVMLVLAAAVISPQVRRSSGAADDRDRVRVAQIAMQFSDELEIEQGLSARRFANETPELIALLADQRTATDAARVAYIAAVAKIGSLAGGKDSAVRLAIDAVSPKVIDAVRKLVDRRGVNVESSIQEYGDQIELMNAVTTALIGETRDAALLRRATAISDQVLAKSLLAGALNRIAGELESGALLEEHYLFFQSGYENAQTFYDRFRRTTDSVGRATLARIEAVPEVGTIGKEAERIIAAAQGDSTYAVDPAEWWRVASATVAAYDQLDDSEFSRYLDLADQQSSDARWNAALFSIAALVGAALAAVFAFLLGRSLSRRLQQVTDSAHSIAVDRLPEVLDSLRNPTPEALAGAIPKVETSSTDEIGSLAESFNTVLRTAVETSIEHSARRAETLTNLLINLGRRNQALLERQLKLIDTLEAREQDPAVLDGLFRLDHMVTRQRRNAESLLVLAGSRRSRAWSEPVPISDVIRGAISEVADMGRVDFEMPPGHDLLVSGTHAVDLSHLLAELIENATAYSSPATSVQVRVQRSGLHVRVWVIDSGVGMTDEELVSANQKVADPPDIDELTTDRVGFQVVGRLARRLGAEVRLQINPAGGVAAGVDLTPSAFEPMTGDLPIVAVAEAEVRAAAEPAWIPDLSSDEMMLADLTAETDASLVDRAVLDHPSVPAATHGDLPRRSVPGQPGPDDWPSRRTPGEPGPGDLPRRVPATPASAVTPLFGRSAPAAPEPAVEPTRRPTVTIVPAVTRPAAPEAVPEVVTTAGLTRRTPGAALQNSAPAIEAEQGLFRRLPGSAEVTEVDPSERLRTLRAFSRGVDEARQQDTPS